MEKYRVHYVMNERSYRFNIECKIGDNFLDDIVDSIQQKHGISSRREVLVSLIKIHAIDCDGCKYGSLGQIHHMTSSGCLS